MHAISAVVEILWLWNCVVGQGLPVWLPHMETFHNNTQDTGEKIKMELGVAQELREQNEPSPMINVCQVSH